MTQLARARGDERGRAQRGLIAKLESRQLEIGRAVVRHNLGTGDFRRFVRGDATARGGEERAVALIGAARSRALGFQDRVRAVRLSSERVEQHQSRYAGFEGQDWQRVQRILDQGEWVARASEHRLLWIEAQHPVEERVDCSAAPAPARASGTFAGGGGELLL